MCDVNDPRILNAYIAITEDEPTDWLLLGYKDSRNVISLYASGANGLSEFREHITNEILFGFVRVDDRFILITYVPDSVSGVRRARALVHSRSVAGILELSHAQFTASSLSDLSDANIRTRLKLGQNQVPNRPRPTSVPAKRTSVVARRRKSGQYPPSPSPSPSPMSERNLRIHTTDEPLSYDIDDRMTPTPTPSTPTSVASSFAESSISTMIDTPLSAVDEIDEKRRDATEAMLQLQLAKKKELEEARFRQFQRDQQEERFKRDQAIKKFEEEQKQQQEHSEKQPFFKKELPTKKSFSFQQPQLKPVEEKKDLQTKTSFSFQQQLKPVEDKKELQTKKSFSFQQLKPVEEKKVATPAAAAVTPVVLKKVVVPPAAAPLRSNSVNDNNSNNSKEVKIEVKIEPKVDEAIKEVKAEIKNEVKKVLMTGFASVQTRSSPFWKRRYFVIENKTMTFYKDEMAKVPISIINLSNVTRLAPANEDEDTYVPNSFVIDTQTGDSYQIFADDKKIVKQIYATLQSSI